MFSSYLKNSHFSSVYTKWCDNNGSLLEGVYSRVSNLCSIGNWKLQVMLHISCRDSWRWKKCHSYDFLLNTFLSLVGCACERRFKRNLITYLRMTKLGRFVCIKMFFVCIRTSEGKIFLSRYLVVSCNFLNWV